MSPKGSLPSGCPSGSAHHSPGGTSVSVRERTRASTSRTWTGSRESGLGSQAHGMLGAAFWAFPAGPLTAGVGRSSGISFPDWFSNRFLLIAMQLVVLWDASPASVSIRVDHWLPGLQGPSHAGTRCTWLLGSWGARPSDFWGASCCLSFPPIQPPRQASSCSS